MYDLSTTNTHAYGKTGRRGILARRRMRCTILKMF